MWDGVGKRFVIGFAALALCSMHAPDALAQEFTGFGFFPANSEPAGITKGPDGNIWFTDYGANNIGRVTPQGSTTLFPALSPNIGARGITTGPDGAMWFTGQIASMIGRIPTTATPANTQITEFYMAAGSAPVHIVTGPDGNLWFTEFGASAIGRMTPAGSLTHFPTPTAGSGPRDITRGPDGNLWFTELFGNRIGRINMAGHIDEFLVPTANSQPAGITLGPDGNLWFTEFNTDSNFLQQIGRITAAGVITEFEADNVVNNLIGITPGDDGNIWYVTYNDQNPQIYRVVPDLLKQQGGRVQVRQESFYLGDLGKPREIIRGPDGSLWMTTNKTPFATFGNKIVRFTMPHCQDAFANRNSPLIYSQFGANGSIFGTNMGAGGEFEEPDHAGASQPINSVWCGWQAPADGPVTFDTTGSLFDTTLAVYTGVLGNHQSDPLTLVAQNNDISTNNSRSRVTFNAARGQFFSIAIDGAGAAFGNYLLNWAQTAAFADLFAAVLPYARSVTTGTTATAFATLINASGVQGSRCAPSKPAGFPGFFSYQTTNASNQLTGTPNTPVNIPAGGTQNFVFAITPTRDLNAAEMAIVFDCTNRPVTVTVPGLNTFLLSASPAPSPDLIAIGATPSHDGIANIPGNTGTGFFAAAGINIGVSATITVRADDGGRGLPVTLSICQTDPNTGACLSPPAPSTTVTFGNNVTLTFTVFAQGTGPIAFDPANSRLFLRFEDASGATRGATSVAVRTQ